MTLKKAAGIVLAGSLLISVSGCNMAAFGNEEEKVVISVGNWPNEETSGPSKTYEDYIKRMKIQHPNTKIIPDTYRYDTNTFLEQAQNGEIPTVFLTWFTEIKKIINAGYAADITDAMQKYGYDKALNPELLSLISDDEGRMYAVPCDLYAQGLFINKNLFRRSGLVNADGSVKIPDTYEEMAQMAQIINEKTGKAGFVIPAIGNFGGWHFMNIAWSWGVDFIEQEPDGSWTAAFNTPECVAALKYVKDLKWRYNALPENAFIDKDEMIKLFATDQAAMCFLDPPSNKLVSYGMNKDNLVVARMPKGPKGRYSQMGGNVQMISSRATEAEIDAVFKWFEITGMSPKLPDDVLQNIRDTFEEGNSKNHIILDQMPFKIWINKERNEKYLKLSSEYCNIDPKDFESYYGFDDVIISPEIEVCAQELYAIFDSCIQEVISDENSDVASLVEKAAKDFQTNYLDKLKN